MDQPSKSELIKPISGAGLISLQRDMDAISQEVTNGYFKLHPECYQTSPDRIREICKSDLEHHSRFIFAALVSGAAEVFSEYAHWLRSVLQSRKLSMDHPIDSFGILKHSLTSRLQGSDADTVEKVMDAGLAALQDRFEVIPFEAEESSGPLEMEYSQALMDGNRRNAEEVVEQGLDDGLHMVDVAVDIVQPAMYEIGYLWQANRITVAQEHLATAISQNALARAFIRSEFEAPNGRTALLSCVEGNHHELGLRMVSDALETKGWEVNYLGADTPTNDLIKHIDKVSPDTLALSVSMPYQLLELTKLTEIINSNFAGKAPVVIIGGLALNTHPMLTKKLWADYHFVDARTMLEELS